MRRLHVAMQALFVAGVLAMIALPILSHGRGWGSTTTEENRRLASRPPMPGSLTELPAWTAAMDGWLRDGFGMRAIFVSLVDAMSYRVFGVFRSIQVVMGPGGRVFLASHTAPEAARNSLIHVSCGYGVTEAQQASAASSLAELLRRTAGAGAPPGFVVLVPSAAALYPDELPDWLRRQCATAARPTPGILARLPAELRARAIDLFDVLAAQSPAEPAIPRVNFHWEGPGPIRALAGVAEQALGRRAGLAVQGRWSEGRSDISQFFPGVVVRGPRYRIDLAAMGVPVCRDPGCFADLWGEPLAQSIAAMRRYAGPSPAGRVLLITDSFGTAAASAMTPYFADVVQIAVNNFDYLSDADLRRVRQVLLRDQRPDAVLLLFHDGRVLTVWDELLRWFYPCPVGAAACD